MNLFNQKSKEVQTDNDEYVDIKDAPDHSINNFNALTTIIDSKIYVEESDELRVLSNTALYQALILKRNEISEPLLDDQDVDYGRNYNESLLFFVQELIKRLNHYDNTPQANLYPYTQLVDIFINSHLMNHPRIVVNNKEYTTIQEISEVTSKMTEEDDIRANTTGFRAQIPYLSQEELIRRTINHARQAIGYGSENINLGYILIEVCQRLDNNSMKVGI